MCCRPQQAFVNIKVIQNIQHIFSMYIYVLNTHITHTIHTYTVGYDISLANICTVHIYMYIYTHAFIRNYIYTYINIHIHTYIHTYIYTSTFTSIKVYQSFINTTFIFGRVILSKHFSLAIIYEAKLK